MHIPEGPKRELPCDSHVDCSAGTGSRCPSGLNPRWIRWYRPTPRPSLSKVVSDLPRGRCGWTRGKGERHQLGIYVEKRQAHASGQRHALHQRPCLLAGRKISLRQRRARQPCQPLRSAPTRHDSQRPVIHRHAQRHRAWHHRRLARRHQRQPLSKQGPAASGSSRTRANTPAPSARRSLQSISASATPIAKRSTSPRAPASTRYGLIRRGFE